MMITKESILTAQIKALKEKEDVKEIEIDLLQEVTEANPLQGGIITIDEFILHVIVY